MGKNTGFTTIRFFAVYTKLTSCMVTLANAADKYKHDLNNTSPEDSIARRSASRSRNLIPGYTRQMHVHVMRSLEGQGQS